ncbi:ATP-binding cassette domain-containing protein [Rhodobacter capsulatus]|uniref:ATP-binding cassette domain-containing protein n=1 Tax=Rhodobacter capsulatus TaxID=1061 RepID=UPI0040278D96
MPSAAPLAMRLETRLSGPEGPFGLDVTLTVAAGEFLVLPAPSGAGKTTLLRLIAGLAQPLRGAVSMAGQVWRDTVRGVDLPVRARPLGFVFQDYALFPNMTVARQIAFALHDLPRRARAERVAEMLELAGLSGPGAAPETAASRRAAFRA